MTHLFSLSLKNYKSYFIAIIKTNLLMTIFYTLGFTLMSVSQALLLGILVTSCHILPVIGSSLIFIPWLVYLLVNQQLGSIFAILVLWILGIVVKEILDNYLVGSELSLPIYIPFLLTFICSLLFNIWGIVIAALLIPFVATIYQMKKK